VDQAIRPERDSEDISKDYNKIKYNNGKKTTVVENQWDNQ